MFRKLAGLTAIAGLFFVGTASAQLVGSSHDLTAEIPAMSNACEVCHAPHANLNADGDLLWNHIDSTTVTYTEYSSGTLQGTAGQPGPVSLLCLSCHDGTVAVDSYGTVTGTQLIGSFTNGGTAFGASLGNDHPIGITYEDALDPELQDPATTGITYNTTGGTDTGFTADLLFAGNLVECGSCHDVHNTQSNAGAAGEGLLRVSNTNSALCLACHNK